MNRSLFFIFATMLFFSSNNLAKLPKVVIVSTGGTISEKYDPKTNSVIPALTGADLIKNIPRLKEIAKIEIVDFSKIDSSQMTPQLWLSLGKRVSKILKKSDVHGVVITHGTDTMAEGAFFLDLIVNSKKIVVFTGAMRDASDPVPDGPANLYNAVILASSSSRITKNWGVVVAMNQFINSSRAVRKVQTNNLQAFDSGEKGYLGYIHGKDVFRFNDRLYRKYIKPPKELPKVDLIYCYAGFDGSFIKQAVNSGAEGLVIEGFGSGNVNKPVFEMVKYAIKKGVKVVITSRVPNGAVYPIYGSDGGGKALQGVGAIVVGSLEGPKARLLLMLALTKTKTKSKIIKYFNYP